MRIFATFKGASYLLIKGSKDIRLKWDDVSNEMGEQINNSLLSKKNSYLSEINLKVGNRYLLECKEIKINHIQDITFGKTVYKNKRCDLMRKAYNTFHFIKGKYKGMKIDDINHIELHNYMIWLAKNSNNESTIKNCLEVLEIINKIP